MSNLRIELIGPSGLLKTWLARPQDEALNIGSSRYADLRVPAISNEKMRNSENTQSRHVHGLEARIEFRGNSWSLINLQAQQALNIEKCVDENTELELGIWKIKFTPCEKQISVIRDLQKNSISVSNKQGLTKPYHLILISKENRLLHTYAVPQGESFKVRLGDLSINQKLDNNTEWMEQSVGPYTLANRIVYVNSQDIIPLLQRESIADPNGKKIFHGTFAAALALMLVYLFLGEKRTVQEMASTPPPKQPVYREVRLQQPKQKAAASPNQQQVATQRSADANSAPSSSGRKGLFAKSRISQLIGKISSTSQREQKVVVLAQSGTQQVASTDRSTAAVEGLGGGGHNWKGEGLGAGSGSGQKIGTSGVGGGSSASGYGKISAGKAGSGDVGLIEEDAEIAGGLDREVIAAYIRSKLGEILYCYERQLSAEPNLFGKVSVKFTIGSTGSLATQKIGESTLKNATVEGCILSKISKWKFPAPQGGTHVVVTYPFLFKSTN